MAKNVFQKVTMWIKHPDEWDELAIDEIIYNALSEHGIEVVKSLPYEEDESYSDEDSSAKDTRVWLKNNSKLFETDYDNMILYVESFEVGAKAWVVNKDYIEDEVPEVEEMKVVHAIFRSENSKEYDELDACGFMTAYNGDFNASGEFVLDDDIIYVFLQEV